MNYFTRTLEKKIRTVSNSFPVVLLTGPRQVGKTTLLQHLCNPGRAYISLDDMTVRQLAINEPKLFFQYYKPPVLIDEIQYAPQLLPYIKIIVDKTGNKGDFWLTGSQQFQMMKGITESLAGRVAIIQLLGFSFREKYKKPQSTSYFLPDEKLYKGKTALKQSTNVLSVYKDIWKGAFPALIADRKIDPGLFYSSYLQTYLQRDVRDLTQVGNLEQFTLFLKACAARTGTLLNYSDLARDIDISIKTVKSWLSILTASYQIQLVPPFHSNITKRLIKTPKLYFLDTGFCSYLTGWSSPETLMSGAMAGQIFETYIFTEILKSWWFHIENLQIYHYRDKEGKEIDFIIVRDNKLFPIEVKRSATVKNKWIQHFKTLDRFPQKRGYGAVICLNNTPLPIDGMNVALPFWCI